MPRNHFPPEPIAVLTQDELRVLAAAHGLSATEAQQGLEYVATHLLRGEPYGPGLSMRVTIHVLETAAHLLNARLAGRVARAGEYLDVVRLLVDALQQMATPRA